MQKQCNKCLEFKPVEDFRKQSATKDGFSTYCKTCLRPMSAQNNKTRYQRIRKEQIAYVREWIKNNPGRYKEIRKKYEHSIKGRLKRNLSKRLKKLIKQIKNHSKSYSCSKYIGCSIEALKIHLESKFVSGMTWENYGDWHIDHIKPLARFDLSLESERKEANHFSNLQPLWAEDNIAKGDKWQEAEAKI